MRDSELAMIAEVRQAILSGRAREIRESLRMSVADVASTVGVSGNTVRRWELGEVSPRGEHALNYAKALRALEKVTRHPVHGATVASEGGAM
ncbi:helix-turn-helix domain-containing protein [Leifsonia sp. 22587]|uniref:helix-turn-helix domain-containing protein n=1 Tax=Leifsonia sp. 22587 TaxID=3453946 RepID=UPI003F838C76